MNPRSWVLPPPVGEKLAIAGHVWRVLDVDVKRHLVYCEQVKGSIPAYFGQCPGDLHTKILQRMRQVLREERSYPYLMKNAVARLDQARFMASRNMPELLAKYFPDNLLNGILIWKEERNRLIHALLMQQLAHNEVTGIAEQGNELVKILRSRSASYNRAVEKTKVTQ